MFCDIVLVYVMSMSFYMYVMLCHAIVLRIAFTLSNSAIIENRHVQHECNISFQEKVLCFHPFLLRMTQQEMSGTYLFNARHQTCPWTRLFWHSTVQESSTREESATGCRQT